MPARSRRLGGWSAVLMVGAVALAQAQTLTPDQQRLREIYQQLVEINTTESAGNVTQAAQAMAARLKAAGFPDQDVRLVIPSGATKKGNLIARIHGTGAQRPMLLLAHLDVVEAKREDWTRDPFKLVEENGYFYGRGVSDDKAMAAIFLEQFVRLKRENFKPNRDIILALTADEEQGGLSEFNGVENLLQSNKELINAELAINEGGGGRIGENGKYERITIQFSEKVYQDFRLQITNPGGHSSVPQPDNAIYRLSEALSKIGRFQFPAKLSQGTRTYFDRVSRITPGQVGADMKAILSDPPDAQALERLSAVPDINAQLRTTCVATMMDGGHAPNALPQRARANVNCRILPGEPVQDVEKTLARVIADDKIAIAPVGHEVSSPPAPLSDDIMKPVEAIAAAMWPGVAVIPVMSAGGTDGRFLLNAGIRTYGVSGMVSPVVNGTHGLNERMRVASLYEGQEFLYRLTKALSSGTPAAATKQ